MNEFETTIYINDVEIEVTATYDYQPSEPATRTDPGVGEEVTITGCIAEPRKKFTIDMFTPAYDWLMVNDIIEGLEEDALAHKQLEAEAYECDKADYLYEQRREAA